MSAETWAQLIVKYSIVDSSLMFNGEQLDKCINSRENKHLRDEMDLRLSIPKDHIGIFHEQQRKKGSTKKTSYYYATTSGKSPDKEKKWFDCINDAHELLNKKITRASETLLVVSPMQQLTKKRKLQASELAASAEDKTLYDAIFAAPISSSFIDEKVSSCAHCPSDTPYDYFDSPEARILFVANDIENTRQSIHEQIMILKMAQEGDDGYLSVIEGVIQSTQYDRNA